jgi:hypothetical protein
MISLSQKIRNLINERKFIFGNIDKVLIKSGIIESYSSNCIVNDFREKFLKKFDSIVGVLYIDIRCPGTLEDCFFVEVCIRCDKETENKLNRYLDEVGIDGGFHFYTTSGFNTACMNLTDFLEYVIN